MNDEKLILVTIGPVQSFIQQARRTIDFYAGSKIITKMIEWAHQILKEELSSLDFELLYPYKEEHKNDFSHFPNYFLAKAKYDEIKFRDLQDKLSRELYKKLSWFCMNIFNKAQVSYKKADLTNHIIDCFNIYLVYRDFKKYNYEESYKNIYAQLNARKNTVKFKQLKETGRKCSVCGIRNGIFYNKDKKKNYNIQQLDERSKLVDRNKIKEGESLCYICFMKRFYDEYDGQRYPSTVELATMAWKTRKLEEQRKEFFDYEEYIKTNIKKEVPDEKRYYKDFILDNATKFELDKNKLEKHFTILNIDENGNPDVPTKYYAVVKIDIDDLGKWLSGKYFDDVDLLQEQQKVSKALYEFFEVFNIYNVGKTVYAGGDDLLFFVTLDNLFEVITKIENEFEKVKSCVSSSERKLTFSTSIVVAHYKTPLSKVLRTLNETLEAAKKKYEHITSELEAPKNAVAITYITYSNTLRTAYFKRKGNLELVKKLIDNLKQDFSSKFIYCAEEEFRKIDDTISYEDMLKIKAIFEMEIKRLTYNSFKNKGKDEKQNINKFIEELIKLLSEQVIDISPNEYLIDAQNYFNFLHIGEKLSREIHIYGSDTK